MNRKKKENKKCICGVNKPLKNLWVTQECREGYMFVWHTGQSLL